MIALDTNILVYLFVQDHQENLALVRRFLTKEKGPFFVSELVLIELYKVFVVGYKWDREKIVEVLRQLMSLEEVAFEDPARIYEAVLAYEKEGDFPDHLICLKAKHAGCDKLVTFDKEFIKKYPDFVFKPSSH